MHGWKSSKSRFVVLRMLQLFEHKILEQLEEGEEVIAVVTWVIIWCAASPVAI